MVRRTLVVVHTSMAWWRKWYLKQLWLFIKRNLTLTRTNWFLNGIEYFKSMQLKKQPRTLAVNDFNISVLIWFELNPIRCDPISHGLFFNEIEIGSSYESFFSSRIGKFCGGYLFYKIYAREIYTDSFQ